jgi:hypothetical protein
MLKHLSHPTLRPTQPPSSIDDIPENELQIRLPLRTATRPWDAHHLSNPTTDFALTPPSSRSTSPSRSSTFLPFLKLVKDRSCSPEPVSLEQAAEFDHIFADEKPQQGKFEAKSGKLASWFSGSSEPVNITLIHSPEKEKHDPFFDSTEMERGSARTSLSQDVDNMTKKPQSRLEKSSSSFSTLGKDSSGSNKFAFWRSRPPLTSERSNMDEDEFKGFNVQNALFPSGIVDESSPVDFKRLQTNAENILCRFHSAYLKSLQLVREVTSEKNVLTDELEAAQAQREHLKLQLANVAAQSAKQESAIEAMAGELAALGCKIREDAEFRSKSLRIVTKEFSDAENAARMEHDCRRKRMSAESFASEESSAESVFSQAPLGTFTPISAVDTSTELHQLPRSEGSVAETLKGCQNCYGVSRSEAWDVVHVLKEESRALKARIAEYECANADALSLLEVVSTFQ